ncbi:MAG: hypothetical protein MRJ52_04160 [Nitrosomonas sp.]|nr:hypothetical protein [Nitrosomonas sp.]
MINTKIDANQVPQDPINRDSYKANFIVHKIPDYSKQQIKSSKRQYGLLQKSQINDLQYSLYVTRIVYHHSITISEMLTLPAHEKDGIHSAPIGVMV